MDKLLFGTAGIPIKTNPRTYENAFHDLVEMKLGCMEIEFVRGVNMNVKNQPVVKQAAVQNNIVLTAHAPYFINLASQEEDKIDASVKRILDTARVSYAWGGPIF